MDDWLDWPRNLAWTIPACFLIFVIVGVLFGALIDAGKYDYERYDTNEEN